jgi:hypothetical protein
MRITAIGREFVAEVDGIDLCAPLDAGVAASIHAAMDRLAVLVFHDKPLADEEQIVFTKSLGKIELNRANNVTPLNQRRLGIEMSDISNLDQRGSLLRAPIAAARSVSAIGCGIRIPRSSVRGRGPRGARLVQRHFQSMILN